MNTLAPLAVTLTGLLIPRITKALTGPVLSSGQPSMLIAIAVCLLCTSLSSQLLSSIRGMYRARIQSKTSLGIQASMMLRVLALPADFFRRYSAGELAQRSMSVNSLCDTLAGAEKRTAVKSGVDQSSYFAFTASYGSLMGAFSALAGIALTAARIRHCDRILVLDKSSIIEDGTYDELIRKNGFFADLVARQRLDTPADER